MGRRQLGVRRDHLLGRGAGREDPRRSAASLPNLRFIVVIDEGGDVADAISLDDVRTRGRGARRRGRSRSARSRSSPTIRTPSSTPPARPARRRAACCCTATTAASLDSVNERGLLTGDERPRLPVPAAGARLRAADPARVGRHRHDRRLLRRRRQADHPRADAGPPDLPAVGAAHLREALHARPAAALRGGDHRDPRRSAARSRTSSTTASPCPDDLRERFAPYAPKAEFVRGLFGGRLREAVTGAAPIVQGDPRVLLRRRRPGHGGLRHDGDRDGRDDVDARSTTGSAPSAARCRASRSRIAEDGEILLKGANIFNGYWKNDDASFGAVVDGWLHTGDVGRARRGRLRLHHRPQEGHHHHGGRQEPDAGEPRERPQADALGQPGRHARRPPAVPGDADHARRGGDRPVGAGSRASRTPRSPRSRATRGPRADPGRARQANEKYAQVEQVKKFFILDHDLSQETGELTPTLKVKRNVVNEKYAERFDALYGG